jgi:hypothetical protein
VLLGYNHGMTQDEAKQVRIGDHVSYLGRICRVDDIAVTGCEYHPYFKLTPITSCKKSLMSQITNGLICYAICNLYLEELENA